MTQGAEAFKEPYRDEETPEEKREAVILPFKRREEEKKISYNPMWAKHAKFMAETASITLSQETIDTYGMLRDEKPDPTKENHSGMSDQEILAEALRISGDTRSLATFTEKYPHIFKKT